MPPERRGAFGGDRFTTLTQGTSTVDTGINLVDTVVRYLEQHSPVDPHVEGRLTVQQPPAASQKRRRDPPFWWVPPSFVAGGCPPEI